MRENIETMSVRRIKALEILPAGHSSILPRFVKDIKYLVGDRQNEGSNLKFVFMLEDMQSERIHTNIFLINWGQ